ncbi:cytochrome c oxidase subunit II (mitochondrion) [Linepithema humile]|uniref:Cytochrome c oxidase subunit 2 n=5 Tax=Linepithema TaxID=83484 RepID=A0A0S2A3D7_LINHU|nr:cytochrome c oxidase subunit II [Linepithema humile]ALN11733.1 cytochrome c oxidase subunit II [Linepithema humile]ANI87489.1 cytochrome c oxidase subunit II [Linepithema humile]QNV47339.1 cytochrome c oxidase subunit II [Linepithema humile]
MNTWTLSLQNSNSPIYDMMIFFHDFTMMILIFITLMISFIMFKLINNKLIDRFLLQGHTIELIWTITPMFILIFIAIPSIKILYLTDEMHNNKLTIKTIGHQWYWSYEYSDFINLNFDSFMTPSNSLNLNEFRLLDVDNRCVLPFNFPIRVLTTSMDVIHSWTVPSLGIKMDSTPGRLNQMYLYMYRPGLYFGQCSEICGTNHSFMPIVIESTNFSYFKKWLLSMYNNM